MTSEENGNIEIPRCENCGKIAGYKCAIDGKYLCGMCARFVPVSLSHIKKEPSGRIEIKVLKKMEQDPKERNYFEALEDLTEYPPPEEMDFSTEWKAHPDHAYGHKEYDVRTMTAWVDGSPAGYLDFVFTIDPMEEMAIQFWEMAIHPKYHGMGVFSAMIGKLKEIAQENKVKRLYVSHENDNLSAIIAQYVLGAKMLYIEETGDGQKMRFGIPRRNDIAFVYELE
ncbi:MAG: GNAT family N-acetyltransferase [Methanomassiliicoccales archaeon]|nr:MAG: GNAT family N-acetyltransferase [Methanomassiliicoccales archaeon]